MLQYFLLPRYYPSPYPVTNRIMTVQPAMSPYMSPVSAYQVLRRRMNINVNLPELNLNLFVMVSLSFTLCWMEVMYTWYVG